MTTVELSHIDIDVLVEGEIGTDSLNCLLTLTVKFDVFAFVQGCWKSQIN